MSVAVEKSDCLIVVDVQNDFCPGGALGVDGGDKIVPVINQLIDKFAYRVASKDCHPEKTSHFKKWPVHCVAETKGAAFHPELKAWKFNQIFLKGTDESKDGYSAFDATNASLKSYLQQFNIRRVFLCGLATDYCVKFTAKDALKAGFEVYVVLDGVCAVNAQPGDGEKAVEEIKKLGGKTVLSSEIR